jgi:DNA modification methylase
MSQYTVPFMDEEQTRLDGPVECLGMTFESDEARRAYFLNRLREKLQDPAFRQIEGFPIGSDEDILALSDPPYYTACPNPFIDDFIKYYGIPYDPNEPYHKEPFAADVSEGKNDPIYNAHSYHTKVPHKAIMRYILHYTKPGDIVLDGFCGTGMTGVAAQMCANPDPAFRFKIEQEWQEAGWGKPEWGVRRAILSDLSPAATFIAYNYNTPVDIDAFEREVKQVLAKVEADCGWMYVTTHTDGSKGCINYTVWSDVFVCPECASELIFWDVAVDKEAGSVRDEFLCPQCRARLTKRNMERAWVTKFDTVVNQTIRQAKQVPVLINYSVGRKRFEKTPNDFDLELIEKIEYNMVPCWYPTQPMPEGYNTEQPKGSHGLTHVHHFYTKRNLISAGRFLVSLKDNRSLALLTGVTSDISKMARVKIGYYFKGGGGPFIPGLAGTLYIPSLSVEKRPLFALENRLSTFIRSLPIYKKTNCLIGSVSASELFGLPSNSIDYIFTDPPFGANLMYSELNFLWEAWLKVFTNNKQEAIENKVQGKGLLEYQRIMEACFREYLRVLKPGHWMTVEFSNTKASVWNAIQTALEQAGFVVANVAALDKQQGSFKAVTTPTAVKQDLVISCYKPNGGLETRFVQAQGSEVGVWEFINTHLRYLPTFLGKDNQAVEIIERTPRILYDRLVAYFVQRGFPVPISSQEFQAGLVQRFPERDGMYFLPEQVAEYERKRMTVREIQQLQVFVSDEASSIQWLRQQLSNKPQTTSELTPQFMRELGGWQKHEVLPELAELLEQNFLRYDGNGPIPAQIVAWMKKSSDLRTLIDRDGRELENGSLETNNQQLKVRAKDRWYVPDPNRAIDLEKVRLKGLLREFATYQASKGRLRQFRTEAVRAGFSHAWGQKDYATIVRVAERLPENVLQEDPDLLMYYDNASLRVHG